MNDPIDARPSESGLLTPSSNGSHAPGLPELPPVEAPSAGFIVQLFVIPAVVVLVVILVWLLFGRLAGGERDAMEYVRLIRASGNNWRAANRAAYELASLIQNDSKVASDPTLLGELTDLLNRDLDQAENPEMTQYVALAIGRFQTLDAKTATGQPLEPLAALARALEPKYADGIRIAAAVGLAKQAARLAGTLDDARAIEALAKSGSTGEPSVRQAAAYALGFFGGDAAREALKGRLNDEDRFVRYNAAVALARRDDPAAAPTLREMLSTTGLEGVIKMETETETRAKIESLHLEALSALEAA
ncbi:MAG: HEAT repeat domain-containing protein, partial [Thermoleophilia bacterium]|nr:HEAT repeat domain-containing protein [Thermoleophilia bacterium]